MHSAATVRRASELLDSGNSIAATARALGVSRAAVRDWIRLGVDAVANDRARGIAHEPSASCPAVDACSESAYAYLLGLYLGDGSISVMPNGVHRLRIACCDDYPHLKARCRVVINRVLPENVVGAVQREGCTDIYAYSKHWVCFFPQHGPGRKHERPIELADWQKAIVRDHTWAFIRGLIHSDGCRAINRVRVRGKQYEYPRYFFSNMSHDILELFGDACDLVGAEWRYNRFNSISIARRASVALLDIYVGAKY